MNPVSMTYGLSWVRFARGHLDLVTRVGAILAMGLLSLGIMWDVGLNGDEDSYALMAETIGRYIRSLVLSDGAQISLREGVIQHGWFMPGVGAILSPVYALWPDVPAPVLRATMLAVNLALVVCIVTQVRRRWGSFAERSLLAVLILHPGYILFLSTLWADIVAVHLAILVAFWLADRGDANPRSHVKEGSLAGAMVAGLTYMRGIYPLFLILFLIALVLRFLRRGRPTALARGTIGSGAAGVTVFAILISPWSLTVSNLFGPTLTVTSFPISQLAWRAEESWVAARMDEHGLSRFEALHEEIAQAAREGNTSYMEAAHAVVEDQIDDVALSDRLPEIGANISRFFSLKDPTAFQRRFFAIRCEAGACLPPSAEDALLVLSTAGWRVIFISGALLFAIPLRSRDLNCLSPFLPFVWKGAVFFLAVHPFILLVHGRYHHQFVPVVAVGLAAAAGGSGITRLSEARGCRPEPYVRLLAAGQIFALIVAVSILVLVGYGSIAQSR